MERKLQVPSFPLTDQASLDKALSLTKQEELSRTVVTLKVANVSLEGLTQEVQRQVPDLKQIEVRGARPVRLSFDLEGTPGVQVGQVLQSAALLAGCRVYLLPGRILLAPVSELTKEEMPERFEWMSGTKLYTVEDIKSKYVEVLAASVRRQIEANPQGTKASKYAAIIPNTLLTGTVRFGDLGATDQNMIRSLAFWAQYRDSSRPMPPVRLAADTEVSVTFTAHSYNLDINPTHAGLSERETGASLGYSVSLGR